LIDRKLQAPCRSCGRALAPIPCLETAYTLRLGCLYFFLLTGLYADYTFFIPTV
jgi:hypothetical protein